MQLHFVVILHLLGTGTTVQGMDVATFTKNIGECAPTYTNLMCQFAMLPLRDPSAKLI